MIIMEIIDANSMYSIFRFSSFSKRIQLSGNNTNLS